MDDKIIGTANHAKLHEKESAGRCTGNPCWRGSAHGAWTTGLQDDRTTGRQDDKEASELARDYEITSPTRFASGAAFRALREIISMVEKKDMSCLQFGERHGSVIRKFLS